MTDTRKSTVERAIELAKAGPCQNLIDIRHQLAAEGYSGVHEHTSGLSFQKQLRALLEARGMRSARRDDDE